MPVVTTLTLVLGLVIITSLLGFVSRNLKESNDPVEIEEIVKELNNHE